VEESREEGRADTAEAEIGLDPLVIDENGFDRIASRHLRLCHSHHCTGEGGREEEEEEEERTQPMSRKVRARLE